MTTIRGWLLDLYPDERRGCLVLWLIGDDGMRYELLHSFHVTFYVAGDLKLLKELWVYLRGHKILHRKERTRNSDSTGKEFDLLAIEVLSPSLQPKLFREIENHFPQLTYFNCDIPVALRYSAAFDVFPMSHCEVEIDKTNRVQQIKPLDTRWELFPNHPKMRLLRIFPDTDPFHERPQLLHLQTKSNKHQIPLKSSRVLVSTVANIIDSEDPDLILADWGDTWFFPLMRRAAKRVNMEFNPNRDKTRQPREIKENSYFSYGRVIYRGEQTHLFGRLHIDRNNAMSYGDYGIPGAVEQAQMTSVPVQEMARKSPGAGITAMFTITSLRRGVLVPNEKLHVEQPKTLRQLFVADKGGLIYQPTLGLHKNVVQIDFSSMYPSIMALWNVSPETVGTVSNMVKMVPELDIPVDQENRGIVSETLAPLLEKRLALKRLMASMDKESVEYKLIELRSTALKWLLVVCFGYQGYKNFREGRIEAHETITAFSRSVLFRTMRIAENMGYQVLHMYVDSLWIKRSDESPISKEENQAVLDRVEKEIGLPISTEARYRFVAFLSARENPDVAVPNRYYGELEDGTFKVRGTASRRHDTPPLISDIEQEILECLANNSAGSDLAARVSDVVDLLRGRIDQLRKNQIPVEQLVVSVNVSRQPQEYKVRSSAAVAGQQLQSEGRNVSAGQLVRFVFVKGNPRIHAWDSKEGLSSKRLDIERYSLLIVRMASTLLQPLGVTEGMLWSWVVDRAWYGPSPTEFQLQQREVKYPLLEKNIRMELLAR